MKTFTVSTIKHSFKNAGMWPVSFKVVKKKLKEYGKKKKWDTGLEFLEYGSESSLESDDLDVGEKNSEPVLDPQLTEEYQLPLLKPPSSYDEYRYHLQELESKTKEVFSSPSRIRASVTIQATNVFLMRGSLHEMEIIQARKGAIATHKRRLNARKSLGKGG
jgi:hypothetical protein